MVDLSDLPPLRDVIATHGLRTKKSLGQHFLLDGNLTDKIVRLSGDLNLQTVIEVGPGPGGLTRSILAANPKQLFVIEKDERCVPVMEQIQQAAGSKFHILQQDAKQVKATELGEAPRTIISNLPYNVGTELLIGWLHDIAENPSSYQALVLMFQKEVAERICAPASTRAYGRISILAQWLCHVKPVLPVPAAAFTPPPKVDSTVIQLVPRDKPAFEANPKILENVVAVAFQQRRKMLRSALKPLGAELIDALEAIGIDAATRPDQLSVEQYCAIARAYANIAGQ